MADDQPLLGHQQEDELWDRVESAPPLKAGPTVQQLLAQDPARVLHTLQKAGVQKLGEFQVQVCSVQGCSGPAHELGLEAGAGAWAALDDKYGLCCGWGMAPRLPGGARRLAPISAPPLCRRAGCRRSDQPSLASFSPLPPSLPGPQDKLVLSRIGDDSIATMGADRPDIDFEAAWRRELGEAGAAPSGACTCICTALPAEATAEASNLVFDEMCWCALTCLLECGQWASDVARLAAGSRQPAGRQAPSHQLTASSSCLLGGWLLPCRLDHHPGVRLCGECEKCGGC